MRHEKPTGPRLHSSDSLKKAPDARGLLPGLVPRPRDAGNTDVLATLASAESKPPETNGEKREGGRFRNLHQTDPSRRNQIILNKIA